MPRIERDFLGEKEIPDDAYFGIQTARGRDNFRITGIPVSHEPTFVQALGYVKKATTRACPADRATTARAHDRNAPQRPHRTPTLRARRL